MKRLIQPFKIFKEERWAAWAALVYITMLNALVINSYFYQFIKVVDNYQKLFVRYFHLSGFDPLTYAVVSNWDTKYNIYRHPLLAFMMWIPYLINRLFIIITGINAVQFIVAAMLIGASFYAFIYLSRIFHRLLQLSWLDSWLLCALNFSFAYVMLAACSPDHFVLSMSLLVFTLYFAGQKMQSQQPLKPWQTILLFFLTAGISLNNGVKILMADLFVNGKKFWRPIHLLTVVIVPCALIWGIARLEWHHYERPRYMARVEKKAQVEKKRRDKIARQFRDTTQLKDTAAINRGIEKVIAVKAKQRQQRLNQKPWKANVGKPIAQGEFAQWTDITTPRWPSVVENLFGESIQLHQDHLLEDNLTTRPVIVKYRFPINYIVEATLLLLFFAGIWCGRKSKQLWLALSFMAFDLMIHVVLGFALNEIYIMGAHWLFVLPIAIGYLFQSARQTKFIVPIRILMLSLTLFLMIWNWTLLTIYLT